MNQLLVVAREDQRLFQRPGSGPACLVQPPRRSTWTSESVGTIEAELATQLKWRQIADVIDSKRDPGFREIVSVRTRP
jgi:hypothetical protein